MSDDGVEERSLARSRSRRPRQVKSARTAALEQLQQRIKTGQKNKYEVKRVEDVFDVVDEREYSKKVLERQVDDWIIDDGPGYVEDGQKIFDDDMACDDSTRRRPDQEEKTDVKVQKEVQKAGFGSLEKLSSNMSNMPTKRKRLEGPGGNSCGLLGEFQSKDKKSDRETGSADVMKKIATTSSFEQFPALPKSATKFDWMKPNLKRLKPATFSKENSNATTPMAGPSKRPISPQAPPSPVDDNDGLDEALYDLMDKIFPEEEAEQKPEIAPIPTSTKPVKPNVTQVDKFQNLEDINDFVGETEVVTNSKSSSAPAMISESKTGKSLNFYWLDMFEEPKNPGVLFIFGKVKSPPPATGYSSCCVVIKNLNRRVFLLPRAQKSDGSPVNYMDVYNEFNSVTSSKYKITSFKCKKSKKKYCFDIEGIPREADYMEIRYSGALPALPQDVSGETFTHAFGTNTPLMETFLLEKKLKGPCWLQIFNCEQVQTGQQQSWSKFEFTSDASSLKIHPEGPSLLAPTLVLVSLNIQSVHDASSKKDSIIFAGVAVNRNFLLQSPLSPNSMYNDFFCLLNKPPGEIWPLDIDRITNKRTLKMDSERSMLGVLLAKLHQLDADVYLGHDLNFELLLLQLLHFKVPHWSRIGRLKRSTPTTKNNKLLDFRAALVGRLLCDVKISAMELIRTRSYDLSSLSCQVLGLPEDSVAALTGPEMKALFDSSEGLRSFVKWGMQHCVLNIRLINELQVLPLAVQITCIAGNTLARTLVGGRAERNEYLLLHAFNANDYIVPDKFKPFQKNLKKVGGNLKNEGAEGGKFRKELGDGAEDETEGPSYSGGLVLAPKKGFYDDYIVLMDFSSLYPSIIQEFNVCFTTEFDGKGEEEGSKGILPEEIRKLVECRRQVKSLMKGKHVSEDLMCKYDIRQKALKLTANSMYGCLGFKFSRFYAKNLAAHITGKGRDILLKTKESVEKMGFEVIYGDTDSLMINTHSQDVATVMKIGNKIMSEVNRTYRPLELEIDGIFRFLLLLKKKKYAALLYNPKSPASEFVLELKGLDMVRRDWAPVASNTARACLNEIMSEQPLDAKIYKVRNILNDVAAELKEGAIPVKDLLITKQLERNPEEYKEAAGLDHVSVALRMNSSGKLPKKFRNGDTVSYLFCTDGLPHHFIEMGAVKKVEKDAGREGKGELVADANYYLAHQVHPVVSRICEPIPGLDPARVAEALGLDSTSYKWRRATLGDGEDGFLGGETEAGKYSTCEKFSFKCAKCATLIVLQSALFLKKGKHEFSLETCPNPDCYGSPLGNMARFMNQLTLFMRRSILKYYKNRYICEDLSCTNMSNTVPLYLERGDYPACACKQDLMVKEYSESQLHQQLNYLHSIFNFDETVKDLKQEEKGKIESRLKERRRYGIVPSRLAILYGELQRFVKKTLWSSAYSTD